MEKETFSFQEDDTNSNITEKVIRYSFAGEEQTISNLFNSEDDLEKKQNESEAVDQGQIQKILKKKTSDGGSGNIAAVCVKSLESVLEDSSFETDSQVADTTSLTQNVDELQKGRAKLVRLQVVSNNSKQSPRKSLSSESNIEIGSEDSRTGVYTSETMDLIATQSVACSEGYQFLSPAASAKELPLYISPNLQSISSNTGSDLIQTTISDISENPSTAYQSIMFDVQASELAMLTQEKASDSSASAVTATSWTVNSGSANDTCDGSPGSSILYQTSGSEKAEESSDFHNMGNVSDISQAQPMQRFVTADNQVVYGYKDSSGEFHFFSPTMNDRESHNEKERKRRSRVSEACGALRRMIPGLSEKTDKATVFEQTARYLKFLRDKFGAQFDQAYCEKFYQAKT